MLGKKIMEITIKAPKKIRVKNLLEQPLLYYMEFLVYELLNTGFLHRVGSHCQFPLLPSNLFKDNLNSRHGQV